MSLPTTLVLMVVFFICIALALLIFTIYDLLRTKTFSRQDSISLLGVLVAAMGIVSGIYLSIPDSTPPRQAITDLLEADATTTPTPTGVKVASGYPQTSPTSLIPSTDTLEEIYSLTPTESPTPIDTPTPTPTTTPTNTPISSPVIKIDFVHVPGGEFYMGSNDDEAASREKPHHTVDLNDYWIMKTEVTNGLFKQCVADDGCATPRNNRLDSPNSDGYPVTDITWFDATNFAVWLSEKLGQPVRLPTEAEWEKAACGIGNRVYPWGHHEPTPERTNLCFTANCSTFPVLVTTSGGDVSPYGVHHMAGNVSEWIADWYSDDYYSISPGSNPIGPKSGDKRVKRGGSFYTNASTARCASRSYARPLSFRNDRGFRLVTTVDPNLP